MATVLPKVGSRFGAPMGRVDTLPSDFAGYGQPERVFIDSGGYDSGGAYWGLGQPLFMMRGISHAGREAGRGYFRAPDNRAAVERARQFWPSAKVR